ncbi:MAG: lipopolysaccharide biosynthesis protein [Pseudomonadota bacterium]|nr:lipopolysaccharide biosynthesis protein [Pseudomonadota bacterium]
MSVHSGAMLQGTADRLDPEPEPLFAQARAAIIWRSGAQIVGQLITWGATFLVIRILDPRDYGLFAMTQVVLAFLNMLNGAGLTRGLIQQRDADERSIRQLYGMLIVLNFSLGALQFVLAPLAAAYFRQPIVADLLRVQSFLYFTTPFVAFPYALLARSIDFKHQARVYLLSSVAGALAALAGAFGGLGVWTLVVAPIALFTTRAIGMTIASRHRYRPSFDFRGAGTLAKFGGIMATGQLFWLVQSQADVFVGGRVFSPQTLGYYTTGLFLTQILVSKFVPAINDVVFSIYARMQSDLTGVALGFLRSARMVMLVAMPFYIGLAVIAEPLVAVVLGPKWLAAAPLVRLLALSMPAMTMQVLFSPVCDALGRPGVGLKTGIIGAVIMPASFLIGIYWGVTGLAASWLVGYPIYLAITAALALPVIGVSARTLIGAVMPVMIAALAMGAAVLAVDGWLPVLTPQVRVPILVAIGVTVYLGWLCVFARATLYEAIDMARGRQPVRVTSAA